MKTTPVHPGMFCWHELVTPKTKEAAAFYKEILGGETAVHPTPNGDFLMLQLEGQVTASFQPANDGHPMDAPSQWLSYVSVDDLDAACARAVSAGGQIIVKPREVPVGHVAIIVDPQGARVALFKAAPGKTDGTNPDGDGAVCWMELITSDVAKAEEFYATVLGWNWKTGSGGMPRGNYDVASVGADAVAVVFARAADDRIAFSRWCPCFQMNSVENVAKRARSLGGTEPAEPVDVPKIGRYLALTDAVGAEVAFVERDKN